MSDWIRDNPESKGRAPRYNEMNQYAVDAWNLMGGLDWGALELMVDMLGVDDIERFIHALVGIRDHASARVGER